VPIHLFWPGDARRIETKTVNVSTGGFYCFVQEPVAVGECIRCIMMIDAFNPEHPNHVMSLECHAVVLRVEQVAGSKYGIAFRMLDYRVMASMPQPGKAGG
jgi:hypothetical protein